MVTRLQGHKNFAIPGQFTCVAQGLHLGVGGACQGVKALSNHLALVHHYSPDRGIWRTFAQTFPGQAQGAAHETPIIFRRG
jgi:hypothetical protein